MKPILVLDFGSQFSQLIVRRVRELGFYAEIYPYNLPIESIRGKNPAGLILSGGPSSVLDEGAPRRDVRELLAVAPVLGICYGMQLLAHELGGRVRPSSHREYGRTQIRWSPESWGVDLNKVWMSHGDFVEVLPEGATALARSESEFMAAMSGPGFWAVQFHPEVSHTENGSRLLERFALHCGAPRDWDSAHILQQIEDMVRGQVPDGEHVVCALSGGVDSSVVAALLTRALGRERVHCLFIDNGLLRQNEFESVLASYKHLNFNVTGWNARNQFLEALRGLEDPEAKRKAIGRVFIETFEKYIEEQGKGVGWLAQGTLYPDVIESISPRGESVTIKSHHNVGGLPPHMRLKLVEPLRELFKDEVRRLGRDLGLPEEILGRHPFPGPGLAIRIKGEVEEASLEILRRADAIFVGELRQEGLYNSIWQAFCVLLPVRTVGVQGDARTYDRVLALRAVTSLDGMTADWFDFPGEFLRKVSNRITNEVPGINRVVYDVTSKPPGTIEWE